jgi:preprotein translocase subunit SecF
MGIIAILLKNKDLFLTGGLIVVVALAYAYIGSLKSRLATSIAEETVATTKFEVSQASVKTLQQAIEEENIAVNKMKTDNEARLAAHQVEIDKAKATANFYKKQSQNIMEATVPVGENSCTAANSLINKELQNAK